MSKGGKTSGDTVFRVAAIISGLIILGIALITGLNSVLRSLSFRGLPASYELSEQLLAVAIFVGLAPATLGDLHVKIELLISRMGEIGRRALMAIGGAAVTVLSGAICRYLWIQGQDALQIGETTLAARIPVAPFMFVSSAGALLATLAGVIYVVRVIRTGRSSDIGQAEEGVAQ